MAGVSSLSMGHARVGRPLRWNGDSPKGPFNSVESCSRVSLCMRPRQSLRVCSHNVGAAQCIGGEVRSQMDRRVCL
jgi:hypothetical protein